MSTKSNKAFTKRVKVRKSGKLEVRTKGQSHFNGHESGKKRRSKRNSQEVTFSTKVMQSNLPHS